MMWFASALDNLIRYNLNWIDYIKYSFNLTSAEEKYFETTKVTCGVEHDEMPLAYITDEQQIAGIFVDFISQISIELENSMEIQLEEREKMESDLENHRIETAIMEKTREREKKFLFTEPIYIMHGKMLVKEDSPFSNINQIENVSIAVLKNDRDIAERLIKLYGSKQIKIIFAESIKDALKMLELNQVAAVAGDETKLSYYLNRQINDQYYRFLEYFFEERNMHGFF